MKVKTRDVMIVAAVKREIGLHSRVVKSKKIYTRKEKHRRGNKWEIY